jgi:hypothetical protein
VQRHQPDYDDGYGEKTIQEEERPERVTHEWVSLGHIVKGTSDTPLLLSTIIYNSRNLNREVTLV